jgi:hypothetical protein
MESWIKRWMLSSATEEWLITKRVQKSNLQGTVLSRLKFRSQGSKKLQPVANVWKTDLKRCFSLLFGLLVGWSYFGGLGFPRSESSGIDTWYPLGVYPNSQKSGHQGHVQRNDHWCQFPLLRWDDDDKRETVSNVEVCKPKRFFKLHTMKVVDSGFKHHGLIRKMIVGLWLVVMLPLPYDDQKGALRWKLRVFCALVPSVVVGAWILIS